MGCPLLDADGSALLDADGEPLEDAGDLVAPIVPRLVVTDLDTVRLTIQGGDCTGGCWVDVTYQPVTPWHPHRSNTLYLAWPWSWTLPGSPPCRICVRPQPPADL